MMEGVPSSWAKIAGEAILQGGVEVEFLKDPVAWVENEGGQLWDGQRDLLRMIVEHDRVVVPAGNSVGKSHVIAWLIRGWLTQPDSRVVTTANTQYQVEENTWGELRLLAARHGWTPGPLMRKWTISSHQRAVGISTDNIDAFQGLHAPRLLVIIDEGSGHRIDHIWEGVESIASDSSSKLLLVGNPRRRTGIFAQASGGRLKDHPPMEVLRLSGESCAKWQADNFRIPGLVDYKKLAEWTGNSRTGPGTDWWRVHVDGELPVGEVTGWFPPAKVETAIERTGEPDPRGRWFVGADVGHGRDLTEFWGRCGGVLECIIDAAIPDHMIAFDLFKEWVERKESEAAEKKNAEFKIARINIDATGEGSGLADILIRQYGSKVERVHFGGVPADPEADKPAKRDVVYRRALTRSKLLNNYVNTVVGMILGVAAGIGAYVMHQHLFIAPFGLYLNPWLFVASAAAVGFAAGFFELRATLFIATAIVNLLDSFRSPNRTKILNNYIEQSR